MISTIHKRGTPPLLYCAYNQHHLLEVALTTMRQAPTGAPEPRKRSGAYYTPDAVAALLARWAVRSAADRVLDPACGDGRFLTQATRSVGVEQNAAAAAAARQRAPAAQVCHDEFFAWARRERAAGNRFDCAVGNPPFIRYQTWSGGVRRRAFALCAELGVVFSGLSASWAPFLVAAAGLLRPGGRLAFVVPAAIGHARYAAPLVEHLVSRFAQVRIVAVRRKLFPRLSEDCWLLFAEGHGGRADAIDLAAVDAIERFETPPAATVRVPVSEWRTAWQRRLRPYLLRAHARSLYQAAATAADGAFGRTAGEGMAQGAPDHEGGRRRDAPAAVRLGTVATIDLGYVTGANGFFHLAPSCAAKAGIPPRFLQTTVPNARVLPPTELTARVVASWRRNDEAMLLLRIPSSGRRDAQLPKAVRRYLDSDAGQRARQAYKCRHRTPWYAVPDVRVPHFFLSYMAGRAPKLVKNAAGASCANALHALRLRRADDPAACLAPCQRTLQRAWHTPLAQLSCEIEGHALGGGMLKLEPREAARVILPSADWTERESQAEIEEAVATLRSWRHYGG